MLLWHKSFTKIKSKSKLINTQIGISSERVKRKLNIEHQNLKKNYISYDV